MRPLNLLALTSLVVIGLALPGAAHDDGTDHTHLDGGTATACDEYGVVCKTVTIDDEDGDGVITGNETFTMTVNITVTGSADFQQGDLQDNLPSGFDDAVEDGASGAYFGEPRGNKGKGNVKGGAGQTIHWDLGDLGEGEVRYLNFSASATLQDDGNTTFSCGWFELNGGATVKWGEDKGNGKGKLRQNATGTGAIVMFIFDPDGDCDGDGLSDTDELNDGTDPGVFNDADGDGIGDGHDACPDDAPVTDVDMDGCEDAP